MGVRAEMKHLGGWFLKEATPQAECWGRAGLGGGPPAGRAFSTTRLKAGGKRLGLRASRLRLSPVGDRREGRLNHALQAAAPPLTAQGLHRTPQLRLQDWPPQEGPGNGVWVRTQGLLPSWAKPPS